MFRESRSGVGAPGAPRRVWAAYLTIRGRRRRAGRGPSLRPQDSHHVRGREGRDRLGDNVVNAARHPAGDGQDEPCHGHSCPAAGNALPRPNPPVWHCCRTFASICRWGRLMWHGMTAWQRPNVRPLRHTGVSLPSGIRQAGRKTFVLRTPHGRAGNSPGATHEIALVAEPARQQRVSVWKLLLLSAWVKTQSCRTAHNDQSLVSHALPLGATVGHQ
jgi:hypothetical protein